MRQGKKSHWQGDRRQTTVWEIANNNPFGNRQREPSWGHGTQKPVECMRRPIVNNSRPGQLVYDPSLGSGTRLIAAEMTGRICCARGTESIGTTEALWRRSIALIAGYSPPRITRARPSNSMLKGAPTTPQDYPE